MENLKTKKNKGPKNLHKNKNYSKLKNCEELSSDTNCLNIDTFETFINKEYLSFEFKKNFKKCWRDGGPSISEQEITNMEVMRSPFNCAFLPKMFLDEEILTEVKNELQFIELCNKNNDLFKFKCTGNLKLTEKPYIQKLCKVIQGPLKNWVQDVSGIPLSNKVSISSSTYKYSDILLCHDDELEGRRIAFILYLVPEWKKEFGGSLDLFSVDKHGRPYHIEKRLYPHFNSFAFFEVSPVSYHQVSEVMNQNVQRVSINGWYYGKAIDYPPRYMLKPPVYIPPGHIEEHILYSWISPLYLDENTQKEIRKEFQEKSEIQISDFLKIKKYQELSSAMKVENLKWKWVGPPYKRHIEVASINDVPPIVTEFLLVMQSEAMFLILSQLTGLSLHHLAAEDSDASDEEESSSKSYSELAKTSVNEKKKIVDSSIFCNKGFSSSDEDEKSVVKQPNDGANISSKIYGKKRTKSERKKAKKRSHMERVSVDNMASDCFSLNEDWESDVEREALTEIKSNSDNADSKAEMTCEVRQWRWGSYSLMRDDDLKNVKDFLLDAMFFCNGSKDWQIKYGGGTVYVAKGEQEQLLTVLPVPNSLALVYRDSQTYKFMKYINIKSTQLGKNDSVFHEIVCEYREREKPTVCSIK